MTVRQIDALIAIVLVVFAVLLATVGLECSQARADERPRAPIPASEWTYEARQALAWAVQVEGGSDADAIAIAHVLAYRWRVQRRGWSFREQVTYYSRPLHAGPRTPRQRRILWGQKVWEDVPERVRGLLERWARGQERSPCRGAVHWAGRGFATPLRRVYCERRTFNRFYAPPT